MNSKNSDKKKKTKDLKRKMTEMPVVSYPQYPRVIL